MEGCVEKKRAAIFRLRLLLSDGAEGETRTPTPLRELDPEPSVSTNSTTSARKETYPKGTLLASIFLCFFKNFFRSGGCFFEKIITSCILMTFIHFTPTFRARGRGEFPFPVVKPCLSCFSAWKLAKAPEKDLPGPGNTCAGETCAGIGMQAGTGARAWTGHSPQAMRSCRLSVPSQNCRTITPANLTGQAGRMKAASPLMPCHRSRRPCPDQKKGCVPCAQNRRQ